MRPILTLTTDFGLEDPFVGIMKGVILGIVPNAQIIDLTHQIEPQNVTQAAQMIEAAGSYFPKKTVHLVVVDPGVGGPRRPIASACGTQFFVAPDNGVLTQVLKPKSKVYELTQKKYFLKTLSASFHGRDLFAPVAAWIAKGTALSRMGKRITDPVTLKLPYPAFRKGTLSGEVIHIDRFGNLVTNITNNHLKKHFASDVIVGMGKRQIKNLVGSYSEKKKMEAGSIINSWNRLEIFFREGNAAHQLKCGVGTKITVTRKDKT